MPPTAQGKSYVPCRRSTAVNGVFTASSISLGSGLHNAPLCFLKGLCVLSVALGTVRRVITTTVNIPFDEWSRGDLSCILMEGGEVIGCSVSAGHT